MQILAGNLQRRHAVEEGVHQAGHHRTPRPPHHHGGFPRSVAREDPDAVAPVAREEEELEGRLHAADEDRAQLEVRRGKLQRSQGNQQQLSRFYFDCNKISSSLVFNFVL